MNEPEQKYGCLIRVTKITRDKGVDDECLVSVIGSRGSNWPGNVIRCMLARVDTEIRGRSNQADNEIQQQYDRNLYAIKSIVSRGN